MIARGRHPASRGGGRLVVVLALELRAVLGGDADALTEAADGDRLDPVAPALLGHWLYGEDRPDDAVTAWRRAVDLDPGNAVAWRNLGLAAYNHGEPGESPARARHCYDRALEAAPDDARLLFESDQLDQRLGADSTDRLRRLASRPDLVAVRDDAMLFLLFRSGVPQFVGM